MSFQILFSKHQRLIMYSIFYLQIEQLSSLADEARSLKDEMDILRHTQDKVARYEATIEAYKKKLG